MNPVPRNRILCVDDHRDTSDFLVVAFSDYQVRVASSFAQAVTICQTESFDLCLTDYRLPDGSGLDLCRLLRDKDPHLPVVFLSGVAEHSDREEARKAGANAYLMKPVDPLELLEVVKQLLEPALV